MVAERNGGRVAHDSVAGPAYGIATGEHGQRAQRLESAGQTPEAHVRVMAKPLRLGAQPGVGRSRARPHRPEVSALVEGLEPQAHTMEMRPTTLEPREGRVSQPMCEVGDGTTAEGHPRRYDVEPAPKHEAIDGRATRPEARRGRRPETSRQAFELREELVSAAHDDFCGV